MPFKNNMNRTFHRRVTLQDIAAIALHAICAFACFWQHTGAWVIIGACLAMTALVAIERAIHTTYVITDEGILHIDKGRLSRPLVIDIAKIEEVSVTKASFLRPTHVALQTGSNDWLTLLPDNNEAFINEINKKRGTDKSL